MKFDVGLLNSGVDADRKLRLVRRGGWLHPSFPDELRRELAVLIATPGLSDTWLIHNLGAHNQQFYKARLALPDTNELRDEVAQNWMSISRPDAVALANMRPGKQSPIPLVSQFRILDDIKSGDTIRSLAKEYWTSEHTIRLIGKHCLSRRRAWERPLPRGFELLIA
ncbi:hypothetical protein [Croceicoccus naphthovorans]|uniref:Uncharacterized protein n=1 Tax=Croceicoccus naphthovorans TaxID=1348774 RepID=A0A0G3XK52_9SPHN|nr:hypothetical protein [Croceicoccus naphthovorans]AKM10996.1 hypothetical protein AB433_15110 [Croceicoccus naphthovorans]MBB3992341.1 hypothetical protein [Croceicoccus naphthovorans]